MDKNENSQVEIGVTPATIFIKVLENGLYEVRESFLYVIPIF